MSISIRAIKRFIHVLQTFVSCTCYIRLRKRTWATDLMKLRTFGGVIRTARY